MKLSSPLCVYVRVCDCVCVCVCVHACVRTCVRACVWPYLPFLTVLHCTKLLKSTNFIVYICTYVGTYVNILYTQIYVHMQVLGNW